MYVNHRDEMNYHGYIKSLRAMHDITRERVAIGICSESEISRVENGDRLPEKLLRDRIVARLGTSAEEYEEYLRLKEYKEWQLRMHMIDCINEKDVEGALQAIAEFEQMPKRNSVQCQFIETMRYMVMQLQGADKAALLQQITDTMHLTIPSIEIVSSNEYPLADQELNLLMEYFYLCEVKEGADEIAWRLEKLYQIVRYIENSHIDMIGQAKVYSRLACLVSELSLLKEDATVEVLNDAYDLCTKAVDVLRDTARLYYFIELMEYKQKLVARMQQMELSESRALLLRVLTEKDAEREELFQSLYTEYGVPARMENFTYLYREGEANCVEDVIKIRRKMFKVSRNKLGGDSCAEKTIERVEGHQNSPSLVVMRDLLEKLGLCGEYKRGRVITNDVETLTLSNELGFYINNYDYKNGMKCLEELENKLISKSVHNTQELVRSEILLKIVSGEKCDEKLYQKALNALELTVPLKAVFGENKKYFSRTELGLIFDLAFDLEGKLQPRFREVVLELCETAMQNGIEASRWCVYELIMSRVASELGNDEKYENSTKMSDYILKECLCQRRFKFLPDNIYNKLWNAMKIAELEEKELNSEFAKTELAKCVQLSKLLRKHNWTTFYQDKINELVCNNSVN